MSDIPKYFEVDILYWKEYANKATIFTRNMIANTIASVLLEEIWDSVCVWDSVHFKVEVAKEHILH
jgi:hypothetical protein